MSPNCVQMAKQVSPDLTVYVWPQVDGGAVDEGGGGGGVEGIDVGGAAEVVLGTPDERQATQYQVSARRLLQEESMLGLQLTSLSMVIPKDCSIRKQLSPG